MKEIGVVYLIRDKCNGGFVQGVFRTRAQALRWKGRRWADYVVKKYVLMEPAMVGKGTP